MRLAWRQLLMAGGFLCFGIYSAVSLQRDYQHVSRLGVYLILIFPTFLVLGFFLRWYENLEDTKKHKRSLQVAHWFSRSATQNLIQYVLAFCFPFFSLTQRWPYQLITLLLLATTLWDPFWSKLFPWWVYRRILLAWSLLCALSFVYPFFWPEQLRWFYPVLALTGALCFMPTRKIRKHIVGQSIAIFAVGVITIVLPSYARFPMLSVWLHKPRFETDSSDRERPHEKFQESVSLSEFQATLQEDHTICCMAPIVAPPTLSEKIRQHWTLDGETIESPELATTVTGNADQRAFRSYYCKKNFPPLNAGQKLRCRLYLQDSIFLGEVQLQLE